jgi:D-apionolactonase
VSLINLKCGNLHLLYENGTIRKIQFGNTEIIRMIYSAVRDRNWGTVPPKIKREHIEKFKQGFEINLSVEYVQGEINFHANYLIRGGQNQISFEMQGKARNSFVKNRIGICVLHPIKECAGKKGTVLHTDNSVESFTFPKQISPHQPLKNIKHIQWEPGSGINAKVVFFGDTFEMEDQRNWTDASFKTYSTPLNLPYPVEVKKGEEFNQKIVLNGWLKQKKQPTIMREISFGWDENSRVKLPEIGFGTSSYKKVFANEEIKLLSALQIQHLRADIHMEKDTWQSELNNAVTEAGLLKVPLFLCLYLPDNYQSNLDALLNCFSDKQKLLKALLPVSLNHLSHPYFYHIAKQIHSRFQKVKVGTGVNANFAELNRNRPDVSQADFISFSVCPQVHTSDKTSIVENLEGLAEVVKSAQYLFPGKPVWVSPVTLKQRFNMVATEEEEYSGPEELAPQVDLRQSSMFAASWTLGAFKKIGESGASVADFYETVGLKGILKNLNSSRPANSLPQKNYPLYYLFRILSDADYFFQSVSSHPDIVDGLVWKKNEDTKIVLANFTQKSQFVHLPPNYKALFYSLHKYPENPKKISEVVKIKIQPYVTVILHIE